MTLKIEPVTTGEVSMLVHISRKTFFDTFHSQNTQDDMELFLNDTFNKPALLTELTDPENHFYFATIDNRIAGYLKLFTGKSTEIEGDVLEIARIYVLQDNHGLGVGKALMQFAIGVARRLSKQKVYLGVWEHNKKAISFYSRLGFKKFGEHIFKVGNDEQIDWLMQLELNDQQLE